MGDSWISHRYTRHKQSVLDHTYDEPGVECDHGLRVITFGPPLTMMTLSPLVWAWWSIGIPSELTICISAEHEDHLVLIFLFLTSRKKEYNMLIYILHQDRTQNLIDLFSSFLHMDY